MVGVWLCLGFVWYNSMKGVMIIVSKLFVVEFGVDCICVNCINLVFGEIVLMIEFMGCEDILDNCCCFFVMILFGCFLMLQDIVNVVFYLVFDEVEFIIGVCFEVDGGCCIQLYLVV